MPFSDWEIIGQEINPKGQNPFDNNFFGYRRTVLKLPGGERATYHGILVGDCVHVVAVESDLTTYLVRQARPNARRSSIQQQIPELLELPGGFKDRHKTPLQAAHDELLEETGMVPGEMELLGAVYAYPGVSDEVDHIYLATNIQHSPITVFSSEATERDLRIITGSFGKIYDQARSGQLQTSAQALAGLAMAAARI